MRHIYHNYIMNH